jgi:hypothetical protein
MKRPSLPTLAGVATALGAVIVRFPGTILAAGAGVGAAISLAELDGGNPEGSWQATRVLFMAFIALPLTLALRLAGEARGWSRAKGLLLDAAGLAAALAYGLGLPASHQHLHEALFIRTAILALGMHFLVALAPGLRPGCGEAAFWEFNWRLFLRFWLAALYSAVLFVGLALAVGSASQLFDLKIKPQRYFELWVVIVGLFNTCFFVHGVPQAGDGAGAPPVYPRGLRMFAQFALAPLVVAYLAILYPYAAKIALLRTWPNGWVALPILCLAVAGILAALLLHPIRENAEERWAAWYWRWFFRAFLPLTALLYLALRVRIGEYGVTESRYFGFVLAGWLALVSIYFWWPANRSIRWLPASLALLCLGCTWGPWGAFAVAEHSQFARLQEKLAAHGLLVNGVLTPKPQDLAQKDYTDLQSMLRYLRSRHDSEQLTRLLAAYRTGAGRKAASDERQSAMDVSWTETEAVLTWLGVRRTGDTPGWFNVQLDGAGDVKGYATARVIWQVNRGGPLATKASEPGPQFELDGRSGALFARTASGRVEVKAVASRLEKSLAGAHDMAPVRLPWDQLSTAVTLDGKDLLLVVLQAAGQRTDDGRVQFNNLTLMVLAR